MPNTKRQQEKHAHDVPITEEMMVAGLKAFGSKFDNELLSTQIARAYRAMAVRDKSRNDI
jgi:hypothetical protein